VRERSGGVRERFDVEEDAAGDVLSPIACVGVDRRRYANGRQSSVENDGVGVVEMAGQPSG